MITLLRLSLLALLALPLTARSAPFLTNAPAAKPPPPPIAVAPAFLDVATFVLKSDGENHKIIVTSGPGLLRVDEPDDRYSIIYNETHDSYIGLEHGNYTYWEFSWPEVRHAVQSSKRYEAHLDELNAAGINSDSLGLSTNAPAGSAPSVPDNAGYVWRPTTDKKRIAGFDCVRWTGDSVSGEGMQAWCYSGPLPKVQVALDKLRKINEPIALVPVRVIVPSIVFPVYDSLAKGGVTPILISWGGSLNKNEFSLIDTKTRDGKISLFTVPNSYMKTTLITMDGMTEETKAPAPALPSP